MNLPGEEIEKNVVEFSREVADDLVRPTSKSIGDNLGLLVDGVMGWIGVWGRKQKINQEVYLEKYKESIYSGLNKIPNDKLVEPEIKIVGPAIEASKFYIGEEECREMFARLIVASCNQDTTNKVHPSFVEILKQISGDEARILTKLSYDINGNFPIADLKQKNESGTYEIITSNFTDVGYDICANKEKIPAYFENLDRLKIIDINSGAWITDLRWYEGINNHPVVHQKKEMVEARGGYFEIKKKYFRITSYGKDFINTCVRP